MHTYILSNHNQTTITSDLKLMISNQCVKLMYTTKSSAETKSIIIIYNLYLKAIRFKQVLLHD